MGVVLGHAMHRNCIGIDSIDVVMYGISSTPAPKPLWPYLGLGVLLVYAADSAARRLPGVGSFAAQRALAPVVILFPFSFLPVSVLSPIAFTAVMAICVIRVMALFPDTLLADNRYSRWLHPGVLVAVALGVVTYFTVLQARALAVMYLNYSDWAIYLNVVDNTVHGRWFYSNELGRNYMGHHFMPGMVLLLAPMLAVFRTPVPYFAMNALVLHGGVLVVYLLARKLALRRPVAVAFGLAALFYPSLSQMTVSICYGFHPLHLTMPLIALFVLLCEQRNPSRRRIALLVALFALTISIKETVPVFFAGLGVVYMLQGRRHLGLALSGASALYFVIVVLVVIPGISGLQSYEFADRYRHLGDSVAAIALSPILRPTAFFSALFRPHNLYFILLLLVPVFVTALARPVYLIAAIPTLTFVCLQGSTQQANIALQYQCEVVMILMVAAVAGLSAKPSGRWYRIVCHGLPRSPGEGARCAGLVTALLLSHHFFGLGYIGKNNSQVLMHALAYTDQVAELRERTGGRPVSATPRLGAHLVLSNDTYLVLSEQAPQDIVVLDLDDDITERPAFETYRWRLTRSPAFAVDRMPVHDRQWLIYRRARPGEGPRPAFASMGDAAWANLAGTPVPVEGDAMSARIVAIETLADSRACRVTFRFARALPHDLRVALQAVAVVPGGRIPVVSRAMHFGDGVLPAYLGTPGDVWTAEFVLPSVPSYAPLEGFSIVVFPKSVPDRSQLPFE